MLDLDNKIALVSQDLDAVNTEIEKADVQSRRIDEVRSQLIQRRLFIAGRLDMLRSLKKEQESDEAQEMTDIALPFDEAEALAGGVTSLGNIHAEPVDSTDAAEE